MSGCSVEGCAEKVLARGWCSKHYYRWRRNGHPEVVAGDLKPSKCSVDGCEGKPRAKGLCSKHYVRWLTHGDVNKWSRHYDEITGQRNSCKIEGCQKVVKAKGYCDVHYQRNRLHGSPLVKKNRYDNYIKDAQCEYCGEKIKEYRSLKYCSDRCLKRAKAGLPDKGFCVICGEMFKLSGPKKVCSGGCSKELKKQRLGKYIMDKRENDPEWQLKRATVQRRRHARKKGSQVERFEHVEIFERDKWVCQLCGGKVNKKTKHPHPQSATLDHVIPLSKGGLHVKGNVQIAHLGCNSRKNDRNIMPNKKGQLMLV